MIKTQELIPSVYFNKSRDFQLLSHIYDIVFNSIKSNIDTIYNNPLSNNSDTQLIDLMAYTLGFKPKHKYDIGQLVAVCNILMTVLKNKGSQSSIEYVANAILKTENISSPVNCLVEVDSVTHTPTLIIFCPESLKDVTLLHDLLDYILPAGMACSITTQSLNTLPKSEKYMSTDKLNIVMKKNQTSVPTYDVTSTMSNSDTGVGRIDNNLVPKANAEVKGDNEQLFPIEQ